MHATALRDWCEGFLYGFGIAGVSPDHALSAEGREALRDIGELTRLDAEQVAEGESEEGALTEIIEFLRVAALLIREEVRQFFRANAYRAFKRHISMESSVHRERYRKMIERFETVGPVQPFTLPPEAVLKRVLHALESSKPRIRYPVTVPTYVFAWLKRVLSDRMLDRLLRRAG